VLLATGLWWAGRSGDQARVTTGDPGQVAGEAEGLADLGGVLPGRLAELAVDGPSVVAYSGTDFELDHPETLVAVSDDGGESFRELEFDIPLAGPAAVVRDEELVIVGQRCEPPNDTNDAVCDSESAVMQGFVVDLSTGDVKELPEAPVQGAVTEAVGVWKDRSVLLVEGDQGPVLLSVGVDGTWAAMDAPAETSAVCAVGDQLIAVASAAPLTSGRTGSVEVDAPIEAPVDIPEVGSGEPLWTASTSADGGASWSEPEPFISDLGRDFSFEVGVSCGPRYVVAHTAQMAAFDPGAATWQPIGLPSELQGAIPPGAAMTWSAPDRLTTWTLPVGTAPPPTIDPAGGAPPPMPASEIQVVEIAGIGSDASVSITGTFSTAEGQPVKVSPSAEAAGLVLEIEDDTANLGRLG
jgi:hypothetical protein